MLGMTNYLNDCFYLFNASLKVDAAREILTVIMMSNDENVCSCKRHPIIRRVFSFWRSLCPFLALRLTTLSLDKKVLLKPVNEPIKKVYGCTLQCHSIYCRLNKVSKSRMPVNTVYTNHPVRLPLQHFKLRFIASYEWCKFADIYDKAVTAHLPNLLHTTRESIKKAILVSGKE